MKWFDILNEFKWGCVGLLCWLLILLYTCSCSRAVYVPLETKVLDSIILHDTTFQEKLVPYKDSVSTPDTTSFLYNPYAYSYAKWSNGLLQHSLGIYPFATVTVKVPYFIEKIRRIEVPKPYPVEKKLTRWQSCKLKAGGYAIFSIIALLIVVFGKMIYKLKKGG